MSEEEKYIVKINDTSIEISKYTFELTKVFGTEINRLQQKLEEQKKLNEEHQIINGELREEIKRLEDNWNKFKDYLLSKHNYRTMNSYVYDEIWLKIKELERGDE